MAEAGLSDWGGICEMKIQVFGTNYHSSGGYTNENEIVEMITSPRIIITWQLRPERTPLTTSGVTASGVQDPMKISQVGISRGENFQLQTSTAN